MLGQEHLAGNFWPEVFCMERSARRAQPGKFYLETSVLSVQPGPIGQNSSARLGVLAVCILSGAFCQEQSARKVLPPNLGLMSSAKRNQLGEFGWERSARRVPAERFRPNSSSQTLTDGRSQPDTPGRTLQAKILPKSVWLGASRWECWPEFS